MLCKTGNYVLGLDLWGERVISIKMMINFKIIIKFIVHLQVLHPQLVTADCAFQAPTSPSPPELQVSNNYKQLKVIRQYPSKTGPLSWAKNSICGQRWWLGRSNAKTFININFIPADLHSSARFKTLFTVFSGLSDWNSDLVNKMPVCKENYCLRCCYSVDSGCKTCGDLSSCADEK